MSAVRTCLAAATLLVCTAIPAQPVSTSPLPPLRQTAEASAPRRVIVGMALGEPARPEGTLDVAQAFAQRARIAAAQDRVADLIRRLGGRVLSRYTHLPYLSAEVDAAALDQLMASRLAASVSADRLRQPTLLRSAALTGADVAWRAGLTGAGWTVALPDTGVDTTHPFLAGKVIAEACFSSTFAGNAVQPATVSLCAGGVTQSTAAGAGMNCDAAFADCDHGTHVAGIVAGRGGPDGLTGIAPEASLIALQVYSGRAEGSGIGAWDSDLLRALEQVYAPSGQHRIAAVNLSLAGTEVYREPSACDAEHPALADAVELLRSVGIATVAAAGNDGSTTGLAAPACLSNVISVGASCTSGPDASFCPGGIDSIAAYSNAAPFLALLAPGSYVTSSIPGNGYETLSGTSMAAPHVAGAIALLKQQMPALTVDEALEMLRDAAAPIDDSRNGASTKDLALLDLRGMVTFAARGATTPSSSPARADGIEDRAAASRQATADKVAPLTGSPKSTPSSQDRSESHMPTTSNQTPMSSQGVLAVTAGAEHTCVLVGAGIARCWGHNRWGQLGDNTTIDRLTPVDVVNLAAGARMIDAGSGETCALTSSGGAKCWGNNDHGQLGDGTTILRFTPVDVVGLDRDAAAVVAGGHSCALTGGGVKCWGANGYGQLGDGSTTDRLTPVDVVGLASGAVAVAIGAYHTCALTTGGAVKCWGDNSYGRLGNGSTISSSTPVDVVGLSGGVVAIGVGGSHACALTSTGGVKCWGFNLYGQVGDGSTTNRLTPVDVVGLTDGVAEIAVGGGHTCARKNQGEVNCWGFNSFGQLGDNSTANRSTPAPVVALTGVVKLAAGSHHTCALTGGGLKCWGNNLRGQLGDNSTTNRWTPVDVVGLESAPDETPEAFGFSPQINVALGATVTSNTITPTGYNIAAVISILDGEYSIGCSGQFSAATGTISPGQSVCVRHLASDALGTTVTTTLTIGGVGGTFSSTTLGLDSIAAAVDVDGYHSCALTRSGLVKCWGSNALGQLGDGTTTDRVTPTYVAGLGGGVTRIAAGIFHTCALTGAGGVQCWGYNNYGQLGDGTRTNRLTPVPVVGLSSGVVEIEAGGLHTCALTVSGGVKCWGANNYGQLGDGTTTDRLTPVDVAGLSTGLAAIAAGGFHTCALTSGGGSKCWGYNFAGQVGDGSTTTRTAPVDVAGLASGVTAISGGGYHTCALTSGGGVKCWGQNSSGKLGDGTTANRPTPVDVVGLASGVAAIAAGTGSHTCALTVAGGVKCWGLIYEGQGAGGTMIFRVEPTPVDVAGLTAEVAAIAVGDEHTCAVMDDGRVTCWGRNSYGQLGDGTKTNRPSPVYVLGFAGADSEPDAFGFTPKADVALGTLVTSMAVSPSGYNTAASVSVSNGEYSIGCSSDFTTSPGSISPGQSVCVRHTASSTAGATVTTILTIGGVSGGFSSTTAAAGQFGLGVTRAGDGKVTSSPPGIDCGTTCSASYAAGTSVALAATPAVESTFTGWSGACTGISTCTIAMTEPRSVTATFSSTPQVTEKISALYIAFFARAADFEGLNFWKAVARDSALNDLALMRLMAGGFANHPSFAAIYGALDDSAYIDAIYVNVGGKPADAAGKAYWIGLLGSGQISRSDFVADFTYGLLEITEQTLQELVDSGQITEAERQDALARKYRMQNRTEVAIAFLEALGPASNLLPTTDPLDPASLAQDPAYRAS